MNPTMVLSTYHRLLTRPLALAAIAAYALYSLFAAASLNEQGSARIALNLGLGCIPLVWILGSGLVGNDVSSGSLSLLLSRPVSRSAYLFSRWAGLILAVLSVHFGLFFLMAFFHYLAGEFSASGPTLANLFLGGLLTTLCHASMLVLLSSFLPGNGDSAVYLGTYVLAGFAMMAARNDDLRMVIAKGVLWALLPGVPALTDTDLSLNQAWAMAGFYLVLAGIQVWAAAQILEARDLSYVNR